VLTMVYFSYSGIQEIVMISDSEGDEGDVDSDFDGDNASIIHMRSPSPAVLSDCSDIYDAEIDTFSSCLPITGDAKVNVKD